jgi:dTDP-4-amino-4,6-dideoxygalactose transaminase
MGMIKLPKRSIDFFYENTGKIFESGNLAEGEWNMKVAELIKDYTGSPDAHAVNSNGSGLFAILRIMKEYYSKRRIFLQANTMYGVRTIAISSGMELCGYVDCDLGYLMPTYEQVKRFISRLDKPEQCVFLLTHIGGWVNPDIEKISELCREYNISLIEDCAHSLGAILNDKHTGLFGVAGVYSLYATKAIPVGEGGIIITKDPQLSEYIGRFLIYDRFDQKQDIGVNIRMSEINALLTYAMLLETENIIENKYKISQEYIAACNQYGWEYIIPKNDAQRSNLYKFILISHNQSPDKEFEQIKTRTSPVYDYSLGFDGSEISKRHLCLPIWYGLESEVVDKVVRELIR